jgi:uncharacterized protein
MIMVDYPRQARLKILGHVEVIEDEKVGVWIERVRIPADKTVIERAFVINVEAYDFNCLQHITPRYTSDEIRDAMRTKTEDRMNFLEKENKQLREELTNPKARGILSPGKR